jgi:hypothetical protein
MKSEDTSRYDLPGSRILIRSLRCRDRRVASVGEESAVAVDAMIRDLVVVRLLEDRRVVKDWHLTGGKRSRPLEGKEASARLQEFNDWAGWPVFAVAAWLEPGPGEELAELYRELHLSRFWPPGMPVEALGALWEERLPTPKRSGVYYTPRRIVDRVLAWVLDDPSLDRRPLRLLDPACGSGYFLVEALRRLARRELNRYQAEGRLFTPVMKGETGQLVLEPARRMELVRDHLFGVDIDPGALELSRRALFIEALADTPALLRPAPAAAALLTNLREGDSIMEESLPQQANLFEPVLPPPLRPFRWRDPETGFPTVMDNGGFTAIVGNPPWVSLKGRHRQAPYSPEVVLHLTRIWNADTYRPNLVEFFIRRAVTLLAEDGLHSFVVPDRVAENEQYEPLRRFMLDHGELLRLHFREPFPGVAADTLIYLFQKRKHQSRSPRIVITDAAGRELTAAQSYWLRGSGCLPPIEPADDVEEVLKKIETAGRRELADFLETGVGFIARPNLIADTRQAPQQQPVIKGEHVAPYRRDGNAFFEFKVANLAGGTRSLTKLAHPDRILLRKTGARLIAAIDHSQDLPEQSLYFAFLLDRRLSRFYDLRFFLGLLNSRVLSFYFRHRKITNRATTPQIKKIHLDSLPIRPIHFNDPKSQELHDTLVAAVGEREAAGPGRIAELDRAIDEAAAALYGLDENDLTVIRAEMNKGWEP